MDIGTLRGLLTAALLVLFLGIVFWAWSRRRRGDFERAARLPLEEDAAPPQAENGRREADDRADGPRAAVRDNARRENEA